MKFDDFEQKLRGQPLRRIPDGWREDILAAAQAAARRPTGQTEAIAGWRLWFARFPVAWGALAAVWVLVIAINVSLRDRSDAVAQTSVIPSRVSMAALRQQRQLLAELIEGRGVGESEPPRTAAPAPRSQRRDETAEI